MSKITVPTHQAVEQLRIADQQWRSAMRGMEDYPTRLRAIANAAEDESRALTLASLANVTWKPVPGASKLKAPHELSPNHNRPGRAQDWARFDRALTALGTAMEGEDLKTVTDAFAKLAAIAQELADASDQLDAAAQTRKAG